MTTKIEWVRNPDGTQGITWNPITGCSPFSEGCEHCYAKRMSCRLAGRFGYPQKNPFQVTVHRDRFYEPALWTKPKTIFVCSMGDLFHNDVPARTIQRLYKIMGESLQHTFIICTKRPSRIVPVLYEDSIEAPPFFAFGEYLSNVWHLTSVENQAWADSRIPQLLKLRTRAPWPVLGVSIEPMLGPVDLLQMHQAAWAGKSGRPMLDWVILGGETGPRARPMHPDRPRAVRDDCVNAGIPFFFKGWGRYIQIPGIGGGAFEYAKMSKGLLALDDKTLMERIGNKSSGRLLDGREWNQMPIRSVS